MDKKSRNNNLISECGANPDDVCPDDIILERPKRRMLPKTPVCTCSDFLFFC